jgi:apolipoprotein N-acyltransferase
VLFEQLREALGWGWLPVASALEGAPHPRMVAAIGGEVLLGFLIVWLGFAIALIAQNRRPLQSRWLYIASAVVLLWWGAGTTLSNAPLRNSGSLNLGFVQPAAKTKLDKSESEIAKDLRELQALTHDVALEGRANLILWPEQVTPWAVNDDFSMRAWVEAGAAAIGRPILFGGLWHRDGNYYNAMSFVTPKGGLAQEFYAKRRLVPFGEYVPFADLGWTRSLTRWWIRSPRGIRNGF